MIDLILYCPTKEAMLTMLANRGLVNLDGTPKRNRCDYCWWGSDGKFMTATPVYSGTDLVTAAQFLAGYVMLLRIVEASDVIDSPMDGEQWSRSKITQWVKNNGTFGTMGGIPYYEVVTTRLFRAADVVGWLTAHSLPGHEWLGGNQV